MYTHSVNRISIQHWFMYILVFVYFPFNIGSWTFESRFYWFTVPCYCHPSPVIATLALHEHLNPGFIDLQPPVIATLALLLPPLRCMNIWIQVLLIYSPLFYYVSVHHTKVRYQSQDTWMKQHPGLHWQYLLKPIWH